jgi:hypothetical protein
VRDSPRTPDASSPKLSLLFSGVRCTHESCVVDAFFNEEEPTDDDIDADDPHRGIDPIAHT